MKEFEIFFNDLTEKAQKELLTLFGTTEEDENWDSIPLTSIVREEEGE